MYSMCFTHFRREYPHFFSHLYFSFFIQGKTTFIHSHGVCNGMHTHTVLSFALTKDLFISFSLVFFFSQYRFFLAVMAMLFFSLTMCLLYTFTNYANTSNARSCEKLIYSSCSEHKLLCVCVCACDTVPFRMSED